MLGTDYEVAKLWEKRSNALESCGHRPYNAAKKKKKEEFRCSNEIFCRRRQSYYSAWEVNETASAREP